MAKRLDWPPKKEDLGRLYLVERLSAASIARVYGLRYKNPKVAESTVLCNLKRHGIKRRDPAEYIRKVTEEAVDDWARRYQAGESLKEIAGAFVTPTTVWIHLRRRGLVLRDKVQAQIKAVTKYEKKAFRGDKVEKAYLMGLRYGDLDVVRHGRAIRVRVSTTHPAMAELFDHLFAPYGHVFRYPRKTNLTMFEWTLECDLDQSFEFMLKKIPLAILRQLSNLEFRAFLSGMIDAEGTIYLHKKEYGDQFELSLSNTDDEVIKTIAHRLLSLGYHPRVGSWKQDSNRLGYPKEGKITRLDLSFREEIYRLLRALKLRHREKVAKAHFILTRVYESCVAVGVEERQDWEGVIEGIKRERDDFVNSAGLAYSKKFG